MNNNYINPFEDYTNIFKALSDNTRLRIMWLLISIDSKISVSEIIDVLDESQYNVSKHLKILKNAGLVFEKKEGKWTFYHYCPSAEIFNKLVHEAVMAIPRQLLDKEIEKCHKRLAMRIDGKCIYGAKSDRWNHIRSENKLI